MTNFKLKMPFLVILASMLFLAAGHEVYGESLPEIHLTILDPTSGILVAQKVSAFDGIESQLVHTEPVQYYKTFCNGSPVAIGSAKLPDQVVAKWEGKGDYQVDVRISQINGYHEENQSIPVSDSYFLEMCQVYQPKVQTKHRIWTVPAPNGVLSFSGELNGRLVKVEYKPHEIRKERGQNNIRKIKKRKENYENQ